MLRDRTSNWDMVRTRGYRATLVGTRGETTRDNSCQRAIHSRSIEPFEKRELLRIRNRSIRKRGDCLARDMIVTNDLASGVELLGCGKVGSVSVGKITSLHALDAQ